MFPVAPVLLIPAGEVTPRVAPAASVNLPVSGKMKREETIGGIVGEGPLRGKSE